MLNLTIKIRPHLQESSHLDFSPKIAIFALSCKEIRRRRRRNGQAGARPCKRTVGDAGIGTGKASQTADIHQAYKCAGAPLSAQRSLFSEAPFLLPVRRKKRKIDCISSFCKNFGRFPEPKTKRPHENTGAARIVRTAPLFIHKLRHFIPTDDLSSR